MPGILLENSALKKKERKKERFSTEYDQYGNWLSYDNNLGFPGSSTGKGSACNTGDSSSIQRSGEGIGYPLQYSWASLVAHMVKNQPAKQKKNQPAMWEAWVPSLDQADLLEEGIATYSNILAWRIAWTEEPGRLKSKGSQRVGHNWATKHTHT